MNLTEEQQRIVCHRQGHAKVTAVAGSGKTTTMVARVHHLLAAGVVAREMMVLMFNRSARDSFAHSMAQRLAGTGLLLPEVRTFHSLGLRLVESFTRRGVLPAFTLVTEEYIREKLARQAVNSAYKQERDTDAWVGKEEVEDFLNFIDLVKAGTVTPAICFAQSQMPQRYAYFIDGFEKFERERRRQRIRFYEDLVYEPLLAMLQQPELAAWVENRVGHIIVDEYQDINEVQQRLLQIIAGTRAAVMVVGDVDQCIYEWRGAKPEYITSRFQLDFPNPHTYTLSYTFRYGHRLSLTANHLISNNRQRDQKMCLSAATTGDTRISRHEDGGRHPVLNVVGQWQKNNRSLREAAVLVRLFAMSVPVELALLQAGIPYRLEGREEVFHSREILALIGYLKLCHGTLAEDDPGTRVEYLTAMLSQPHLGIRQEDLERLATEIAEHPAEGAERILARVDRDAPVFIRKKMEKIAENWQWLTRLSTVGRTDTLLRKIINRLELYEFYYSFSSRLAAAENRIQTCQAFVEYASRQQLVVDQFLQHLESLRNASGRQEDEQLLITSIHRAKGLEWPLVIVPGLKEGLFPFLEETSGIAADGLEDERRLFYVAITRAIEQVALVHPPDYRLQKQIETGTSAAPTEGLIASRFLYEANLGVSDTVGGAINLGTAAAEEHFTAMDVDIANAYLQALDCSVRPVQRSAVSGKVSGQRRRPLKMPEIVEGLLVLHDTFGSGVVTEVLDRRQGRLQVLFDQYGEKILLASLAKLRSPE